MTWSIFLNFLTALAIVPPILKWCFFKSYRISLKRKDFETDSIQLSKYIKNTYKERENKEPSELQAETDTFLVDNELNYKIVFYALDKKVSRIFKLLKNIKYAQIFLDIDLKSDPIQFKSILSKKKINIFFIISFILHIMATIFWLCSYFIESDNFFGIPKAIFTLIIVGITAFLIRISTQAKTIDLISKDIDVEFPN